MRVSVPDSAPTAPRPTVPTIPAAPGWSVLDGMLALVALALAVLIALFPANNADLWQHLAAGRLVAHGAFPFGAATDPFSALNPAPPWVNHSWLTDLLMYSLYQVGDGSALVVAKTVLVVLLALVLMRIRRPGTSVGLPAIVTLVVLLALIPAVVLRPPVVSYLLFAILLLLLHRRPRRATLWRLPLAVGLLFALWVNLDGGFVAGLMLLAVWLVGELLQRAAPLGIDEPAETPHPPAAIALALAAALVGCVVSPYLYRTLSLPTDFVPLRLPEALRHDRLFEVFFLSPFSKVWLTQSAGPVAATAYYLLLALGLASFALNSSGWRWSRVLAWAVFAWLGTYYWRLLTYFAVLSGPVLVWNVQAFVARRAAARTEPLSPSAAHTRAFLLGAGRMLALVAGLALLALAWPGWLAAEPARSSRRVGWGLVPEPTLERLAKRLAGWYDAGLLSSGIDHGFYLAPEFANYCDWFCPQEKSVFDPRLTAPLDDLGDWVELRGRLLALPIPPRDGPPKSPDDLLQKYGFTHVMAAGWPALEGGMADAFFARPWRWPALAIEGRGLMVWNDASNTGFVPHEQVLRLDPVRLAVGSGVVKLPAPADTTLREPSLWQLYMEGAPAVAPESYEAALWLVYRDKTLQRSQLAGMLWQFSSSIGRSAPPAIPDLATVWLDFRGPLLGPWLRAPAGRAGRAAALLALRTARRATQASPDNYEGYLRLVQAYRVFDTDEGLSRLQQITAARQALDLLPIAREIGQSAEADEQLLHGMLLDLYQNVTVPGGNSQPLDLLLESLERNAILLQRVVGAALAVVPPDEREARGKAAETDVDRMKQQADGLRAEVKQRRDALETAAVNVSPLTRAVMACQRGLVRDALLALADVNPKDLDPESPGYRLQLQAVQLKMHLLLLAGAAETVRDLLRSDKLRPLTVLPLQVQGEFRQVNFQTAAVLGDYDTALAALADMARATSQSAKPPAVAAAATLFFADMDPAHPLTRVLTVPLWGGLWQSNGQPAVVNNRPQVGALLSIWIALQQQADRSALEGLLALEQGNVERARQELAHALRTAGPTVNFNLRGIAEGWLQILPP